ncbi:MAG: type II toxin-antitoxin system VapC family toxin [Xanthomonadales bacterium]|nr:type II toxin-antitoxin system VapC family toxin [Xanthomonadales bacterium]
MGLIYLDTCILIYLVERHPLHAAQVETALESADARLAVSPLVKLECLVQPLRQGDLVRQRLYEGLLDQLHMLPMDESVYLAAAQLRARFNLRTPDALHLACAQVHGCDALWTNDDRLVAASHGLAVNILT